MIPRIAPITMVLSGLATVLITFYGAVNYISPFYDHTYIFAWYGLIVFLDGLLWWRWDESLIFKKPREFITLLFWSAVFWFFFEIWNLHLKNWYFVGAPHEGLWSHIEAYIDFATVLPGMFLVYRLLSRLKIPGNILTKGLPGKKMIKVSVFIGVVMLLLPMAYPDYFYPFVWGAFIFLLEPLCATYKAPSLLKDLENGKWSRIVRLLLAGLLSGGYWELCNFWSMEKWIYTVPFFSQGKLFEMPYLGFLGFPLFCVECFVMINAVYLLRGGKHWDEGLAKPIKTTLRLRTLYLVMIPIGLFIAEWSYQQMQYHTVDSHAESLEQILKDISPWEAATLSRKGWRYGEQVLENWQEAKASISTPFRSPFRQRLELAGLLHMGSANARLLESIGIHSRKELTRHEPDELFLSLNRANEELRLRRSPLMKRRIIAWIAGAKRRSALY
ncbi:MAG: hypothetical protein BBJ60_02680 [Desulfobacterales bacterium S7086C20]|nr:MAG: hypothetical protein BBJ60_02680 [Desulfobacterales bacterium S7086C20]